MLHEPGVVARRVGTEGSDYRGGRKTRAHLERTPRGLRSGRNLAQAPSDARQGRKQLRTRAGRAHRCREAIPRQFEIAGAQRYLASEMERVRICGGRGENVVDRRLRSRQVASAKARERLLEARLAVQRFGGIMSVMDPSAISAPKKIVSDNVG
jgi:hypothetical protein